MWSRGSQIRHGDAIAGDGDDGARRLQGLRLQLMVPPIRFNQYLIPYLCCCLLNLNTTENPRSVRRLNSNQVGIHQGKLPSATNILDPKGAWRCTCSSFEPVDTGSKAVFGGGSSCAPRQQRGALPR